MSEYLLGPLPVTHFGSQFRSQRKCALCVLIKHLCFQVFTMYSLIWWKWLLGQMLVITVVSYEAYMRMWFCASHLTWVVLPFTFNVFSLIHKTWLWCASPIHAGTGPDTEEDTIHENFISWSKAHFFLLFCNNSSNEKENEITSRTRWSMTFIQQLGHMLWFSLCFIQAFMCTCKHTLTVLQMPHRCKQDTGCSAAKTLLRLSLMYSKVCASNESPPLTKAIV